ncbi:hypothetical protein HYR69_09270, partial [Candidatus Sumerlaeota bacterium]|nr:hypothetical protein [Candidatus Sumerlaeota bacterium]
HQALAPHPAFRVLLRFIPDFSLLDQFQRYVDGGPALGALAFAGCLLYGLLWFALFARLTLVIFRRRGL